MESKRVPESASTVVKNVKVQVRPYTEGYDSKDSKGDRSTDEKFVGQFISERFVAVADNGTSAVMMGSTYATARSDYPSSVLDASELHYLLDKDGVRIGMTMATVDGLGHGASPQHNAQISTAANYVCERANNIFRSLNQQPTAVGLKQQIIAIGQDAIKAKILYGNEELSLRQEESSLALTSVRYDEKGQLHGFAANVGDGMVVILDGKTHAVKQTLDAKVYGNSRKSKFNPMSVQRATDDTIDVAEIKLAEGDLVVHLTDGMWSELASSTEEKILGGDEKSGIRKVKATQLDSSKFTKMLSTSNPRQLASQIVDTACKAAIKKRQEFKQLFDAIPSTHIDLFNKKQAERIVEESKAQEKETDKRRALYLAAKKEGKPLPPPAESPISPEYAYTVEEWLRDCEAAGLSKIDDTISALLSQDKHDGIGYPKRLKTSAAIFISDMQRKPFGDCATVAIMQVPILKVELARALLTHPEKAPNLIKRLIQIVPQEENEQKKWKEEIIAQLSNETFIPRKDDTQATPKNTSSLCPMYDSQQIELLSYLLDFVVASKKLGNRDSAWKSILTSELSLVVYHNLSTFSDRYLGYRNPPPCSSEPSSLLPAASALVDSKHGADEERNRLLAPTEVSRTHGVSRKSIDQEAFNSIINKYESSSFLSSCCCGLFSKYRSTAIRELRKLSDNLVITKEQIEAALGKDSTHRLGLFQGKKNEKSNGTSTDKVIENLMQAFK